jgi:hypothetical protein
VFRIKSMVYMVLVVYMVRMVRSIRLHLLGAVYGSGRHHADDAFDQCLHQSQDPQPLSCHIYKHPYSSCPILFSHTFQIFFIHSEQDARHEPRSGAYISSVRDQKSLEGKVIRLDLKKNKKNGNIRSVTPESCE